MNSNLCHFQAKSQQNRFQYLQAYDSWIKLFNQISNESDKTNSLSNEFIVDFDAFLKVNLSNIKDKQSPYHKDSNTVLDRLIKQRNPELFKFINGGILSEYGIYLIQQKHLKKGLNVIDVLIDMYPLEDHHKFLTIIHLKNMGIVFKKKLRLLANLSIHIFVIRKILSPIALQVLFFCIYFHGKYRFLEHLINRLVKKIGINNLMSVDRQCLMFKVSDEFFDIKVNNKIGELMLFGIDKLDINYLDATPVFLLSCYDIYFKLYGHKILYYFFNEAIKPRFHCNIVDPSVEIIQLLTNLSAINQNLTFSFFNTDDLIDINVGSFSDLRETKKTLYACSRFLILPEILNKFQAPVLIIDSDSIIQAPSVNIIENLQKRVNADLSIDKGKFIVGPGVDYHADLIYFNFSTFGIRFSETLKSYLLYFLQNGLGFWTLDQCGINAVSDYYLKHTKISLKSFESQGFNKQDYFNHLGSDKIRTSY
jgi:hypothetical protein